MPQKLSVVIVDDSRSVLSQLQNALQDMEDVSLVGSAEDGASALRVVAETDPDLLVMDIVMPQMDGLTALRLLRARYKDLRVAMLSSVSGSSRRAEEAFSLGALQVLPKPVDLEQLQSLVADELRHKSEAVRK